MIEKRILRSPIIILSYLLFSSISIYSLFVFPLLYNEGMGQSNTILLRISPIGVLLFIVGLGSFLFFKLSGYLQGKTDNVSYKQSLIRWCSLIAILATTVFILALLYGLLALGIYKGFKANQSPYNIQSLIFLLSNLITVLLMPVFLAIGLHWLLGIGSWKSRLGALVLVIKKLYVRYLILLLLEAALGFFLLLFFIVIPEGTMANVIKTLFLGAVGSLFFFISVSMYFKATGGEIS